MPTSEFLKTQQIPRTIHYCWFGRKPLSDLNKRCIDSWHRVLPDYQIKLWNETNVPLQDPYTVAAYSARAWSRLSNYVRVNALYQQGGIYLDTDVEVRKDFGPLMQQKCFLGFQQPEEQMDWVNSAVLGAQQGLPFLKQCLQLTQEIFAATGEFPRSPFVVTKLLKKMGLRDYKLQEIEGVTIYPVEYFYPYPWFGEFSTECITENTYCIHYWEGTWWRKQERLQRFAPRRVVRRMLRAFGSRVGSPEVLTLNKFNE